MGLRVNGKHTSYSCVTPFGPRIDRWGYGTEIGGEIRRGNPLDACLGATHRQVPGLPTATYRTRRAERSRSQNGILGSLVALWLWAVVWPLFPVLEDLLDDVFFLTEGHNPHSSLARGTGPVA